MRSFRLSTKRREELVDITPQVERIVVETGARSGICLVYCPHTTGAVTVNEGADPDVARDVAAGMARLVPRDWPFAHTEGNSDAHLKASLVGTSQALVVDGGRPVLGTWQRIFFCEFDGPRERTVLVQVMEGGA